MVKKTEKKSQPAPIKEKKTVLTPLPTAEEEPRPEWTSRNPEIAKSELVIREGVIKKALEQEKDPKIKNRLKALLADLKNERDAWKKKGVKL